MAYPDKSHINRAVILARHFTWSRVHLIFKLIVVLVGLSVAFTVHRKAYHVFQVDNQPETPTRLERIGRRWMSHQFYSMLESYLGAGTSIAVNTDSIAMIPAHGGRINFAQSLLENVWFGSLA